MEPSRGKSLCLPCARAAPSEVCVADPERFRQPLEARHAEHPELFPKRCAEGFGVQDKRCSITPPLWTRRSALTATAARCQSRPSCVLPSMAARTAAVAKALALRHWGVPFDALAYVCGVPPLVLPPLRPHARDALRPGPRHTPAGPEPRLGRRRRVPPGTVLPAPAPSARGGSRAPARRRGPRAGPHTRRQRAAGRWRLSLPRRPSPLQRARPAQAPSRPAPRREALPPWARRRRPPRRARHGSGVELPSRRRSLAARRCRPPLTLPRPQRLRVSPPLAPQPADRLFHGRSKTMNPEIR